MPISNAFEMPLPPEYEVRDHGDEVTVIVYHRNSRQTGAASTQIRGASVESCLKELIGIHEQAAGRLQDELAKHENWIEVFRYLKDH